MTEDLDVVAMRSQFLVEVEKSYSDGKTENIKEKFQQFKAPVAHKRGALEQAMRDKLLLILNGGRKPVKIDSMIRMYESDSDSDNGIADEGGGPDGENIDRGSKMDEGEDAKLESDKNEADVKQDSDNMEVCEEKPADVVEESATPLVTPDREAFERFIKLCVSLCRDEVVTPVLSVVLLGDIFDATTLDICQSLFEFVESNVATWKEPLFFATCKNNILRMCNDLLRRLSKSQNTIFCGRILLFLAMFFPFSERSGLNIVSEFNLENVTKYGAESSQEDMESNPMEEIVPETSIKIDYNFYVKFWSLQDYFRSPNQCYNKVQWKEFVNHSNAVLSVFKNYRVEADPMDACSSTKTERHHYFAKFLTNQKLLVLQLNDVHFRRTIYLQFLILFQFLNAHVKSKPESYELKLEQAEWVVETTELIHKLMRETPPNGEKFMATVLKILEREEHWNMWKNEGCPALKPVVTSKDSTAATATVSSTTATSTVVTSSTSTVTASSTSTSVPTSSTAATVTSVPSTSADVEPEMSPDEGPDFEEDKRPLGQVIKELKDEKKFYALQSDGKTKIWNFDTEGHFKHLETRKFVPKLKEFFDDVIEQADPSSGVEQKDKKVEDINFLWSALRLLRLKSPHFYGVTHNPIPKQPDFIEQMCKRISKEPYYNDTDVMTRKRKQPKNHEEYARYDPSGLLKVTKEYFTSEVEESDEEVPAKVDPVKAVEKGVEPPAKSTETKKTAESKSVSAKEVKKKEDEQKGAKSEVIEESDKVNVQGKSDVNTKDSKDPPEEAIEEDDEDVDDDDDEEEPDNDEDYEDLKEDANPAGEEDKPQEDEVVVKKKRQIEDEQKVKKDGKEESDEGSIRKKLRRGFEVDECVNTKNEADKSSKTLESEEVIEIDLEKVQDESLIKILAEEVMGDDEVLVESNPKGNGEVVKDTKDSTTNKVESTAKVRQNGATENKNKAEREVATVEKPHPPPSPKAKPTKPQEDNKRRVATRREPSVKKAVAPVVTKKSTTAEAASNKGERAEVNDKALDRVAKVIGADWTKLAEKMGYKQPEIKKLARKGTNIEKSKLMLQKLITRTESTTVEWLIKYLKSAGLEKAALQLTS